MDVEPLRDRRHALAALSSGSNSFYFLLPRGLFVKEQRKLAESLSRTKAEEERLSDDVVFQTKHLAESLDLLEDAYDRYLAAAPADRKQLNNALMDRVLIGSNPEDTCVELRPEIAKLGLRGAAEEDFV